MGSAFNEFISVNVLILFMLIKMLRYKMPSGREAIKFMCRLFQRHSWRKWVFYWYVT